MNRAMSLCRMEWCSAIDCHALVTEFGILMLVAEVTELTEELIVANFATVTAGIMGI
jgi:hypothetical protein